MEKAFSYLPHPWLVEHISAARRQSVKPNARPLPLVPTGRTAMIIIYL